MSFKSRTAFYALWISVLTSKPPILDPISAATETMRSIRPHYPTSPDIITCNTNSHTIFFFAIYSLLQSHKRWLIDSTCTRYPVLDARCQPVREPSWAGFLTCVSNLSYHAALGVGSECIVFIRGVRHPVLCRRPLWAANNLP